MIKELKTEIKADEGRKHSIYKCTAGEYTFGIGHKIKPYDPEFGKPEGTFVMPMRVEEAFENDIKICLNDCRDVFSGFDIFPTEVQKILANMMFQLGINRFRKFKKMIAAIDDQNWSLAADEMRDSLWNKQTPARSERLISRMKSVS